MPTIEQLEEDAASLADEELIARLRSGNLTEVAAEILRRELTARGVRPEAAMADLVPPAPRRRWLSFPDLRRSLKFSARLLRFPVRAVLGVEPLWAVFVFGGLLQFLLFKLLVWGLASLHFARPTPRFALSIAYAGFAVFLLGMLWYAVALWRSAPRTKTLWRIAVRAIAVLMLLYVASAPFFAVPILRDHFGSPPASIMDSGAKQ